jgi:hypothetical protein
MLLAPAPLATALPCPLALLLPTRALVDADPRIGTEKLLAVLAATPALNTHAPS